MRIVFSVVGVVMILLGSIWIMQGLNFGPKAILQGFMVADPHWAVYGGILAACGIVLMVWSNRRKTA